jgi:hypothetical protein
MHERRARVKIFSPPAAVRPQIVDDDDLVTGSDERVDEVRADEAGSAGNHDTHYGRNGSRSLRVPIPLACRGRLRA